MTAQNNNLLQTCPSCYEAEIGACTQTITIDAGLPANHDYVYCITDKHGNRYRNSFTTDGEGKFIITADTLPTGLLNPYAGAVQLQIFSDMQVCEPLSLQLCGASYDCIQISTFGTNAPVEDARIPCCSCQTSITINSYTYDCTNHQLHFNYTTRCQPEEFLIFDMTVLDSDGVAVAHNWEGGAPSTSGTYDELVANWFSLPDTPPANGTYQLVIILTRTGTLETVYTNEPFEFVIDC